MKFETSKKIDEWINQHREKCVSHSTAGEQFIYKFIPTSIIECQSVECACCKEKFTDYIE